jgi:large subunit ribosomal protein L21
VLLVAGNGDTSTRIGSPAVDAATVRAEVIEHARGEKVIVFRYKSKVRYRRKTGHRQALTRVRITDILLDGQSTAAAAEEAPQRSTRRRRSEPEVAAEVPSAPQPSAETEMPSSAGESGPPPEEETETPEPAEAPASS